MKPLPDSITTALAAFATGGHVAVAHQALDANQRAVGLCHRDIRVAGNAAGKPLETWIRRRWNRRAGTLGYVNVRVSCLTDHRDGTSVPCITVETSGYGADRASVTWTGHGSEGLGEWVDRCATAWKAMSVRPGKAS